MTHFFSMLGFMGYKPFGLFCFSLRLSMICTKSVVSFLELLQNLILDKNVTSGFFSLKDVDFTCVSPYIIKINKQQEGEQFQQLQKKKVAIALGVGG